MEGYLVRIPRAAWLGESTQHPRRPSSSLRRFSSKRSCAQAQLLYYVLGEGYLKGYVALGDDEPVDVFQLTSFHVQVDPMYSMLMFEVFASAKVRGGGAAAQTTEATKKTRRSKASKSGDDSSSDDDSESDGDNDNATKQQEPSILLFAANKKLVETWGSRLLNWNRYVFGSFGGGSDDDADEPDPVALEASKQELLAAFQQHCDASWFSHPLSLKPDRSKASDAPINRKGMTTTTGGGATKALGVNPKVLGGDNDDLTKPGANTNGNAPPSKPWWMLNASQIRRVSSNSLHKSK